MKIKLIYISVSIIIICVLAACSSTKDIPQGQYLLDKVSLDIDNPAVNNVELEALFKQKPNDPKLKLRIYNMIGSDTTTWLKKKIKSLGEPPVIYSQQSTAQTVKELTIEMKNKGYLNNNVISTVDTVGKKARVKYTITSNAPYRVHNFEIARPNERIDSLIERRNFRNRSLLKTGTIFDMATLESERSRISSMLRNRGYFAFSEDNLHYYADTTLKANQVDLRLAFLDSVHVYPSYIRNVNVYSGYDPLNSSVYVIKDTVQYNGITIYYDSTHFLRPKVLDDNVLIRPEKLYRENLSNRTYNYIKSLRSIGRTNIMYETVNEDSTLLDCNIYITPSDIHSIQLGLDGTTKAGDFGIASNITYTHHNIFNGAEELGIKLRGAYEFVSGESDNMLTHNYYEFGIGTSLKFPKIHIPFIGKLAKQHFFVSSEYSVSFDIQDRPEYTREFFNFSWKNRWENDSKTLSHTLNLLDINYVMMPVVSDTFQTYLNQQSNSLTKYSYENIFTAGLSYNLVYSNSFSRRHRPQQYTIRFNAESSGNILNSIFSLANANKSSTGQYNILGNPFAQYLKGDISYSQTYKLDSKNSLAFHLMTGVAYAYGNSTMLDTTKMDGSSTAILPFEKRYYSGGPNSIRGWSTRHLGPGSYNGDENNLSTHVGDIKLEMSLEYRYRWIKWLEFALFTDAGNIWTIRDYDNQQGGKFDFNKFYKEIAIGAGFGLRFDLTFLILRIDAAKRVYDPGRAEGDRWTFLSQKISGKNSGIYFAIGYPF